MSALYLRLQITHAKFLSSKLNEKTDGVEQNLKMQEWTGKANERAK